MVNIGESYSYTFNATRNGTVIPDQDWTGILASKWNIIILIHNGSTIIRDYYALSSTQFCVYVEGNISINGKILFMIWISPVQDTYSLSDDGQYMIDGERTDEKLSVNGDFFSLTKKEYTL
ncbi:hypothetical protein [Methanospirillum lacunae]|uniref:hypothetical protein n=1 Tax=Methanospirillum lacunae TaxID=668570 RepID=UPI0038FC3E04